jgi:hypothetical protein
MKNENGAPCDKNTVRIVDAKEGDREFKPTITRMDKLMAQAGGIATAISIGVSVKGTW